MKSIPIPESSWKGNACKPGSRLKTKPILLWGSAQINQPGQKAGMLQQCCSSSMKQRVSHLGSMIQPRH